MTYSPDTPILGQGTVSAELIQSFFADRGARYAPDYAPDGRYVSPPADLGLAIVEESARYPEYLVNHDLVAGQVIHETAAWQSRYARERNNPGGIGAINANPDLAIHFPSVRAGVRAHVAHLLVYAVGDGPWTADDPRYRPVKALGWLGVAPRWRDLNGRWAYPGTTYASGIVEIANRLVTFAGELEPMSREPRIIRMILPRDASNTPQRTMDWQWITVHNTGNPKPTATARMHGSWLMRLAKAGAEEPSWHYTVDDTEIVQHLEDDQAGWHASDGDGGGNMRSLGIELVEIGDQDTVLRHAAWLIATKLREKGKGIEAVRQHYDWARDKKNCPRLLRANNGAGWNRLLALIQDELDARQPDPNIRSFTLTGATVRLGFKGFFEKLEQAGVVWQVLGYPERDEFSWTENGRPRSAQKFQRGWLLWLSDSSSPDDIVIAFPSLHPMLEDREREARTS